MNVLKVVALKTLKAEVEEDREEDERTTGRSHSVQPRLGFVRPLVQLGRLANCMVYGCIKTPGGQWPLTSAVDIMSGHASRLGWP